MGPNQRDVLRQAAEAAARLLIEKREERAKIDADIARLEAVISAHEGISGRRQRKAQTESPASAPGSRARARRGQVVQHVDSVLAEQPMSERELRQAIRDKFDVEYRRSAVYTVLQRGKTKRYEQVGDKWRKVA